MTDKRPVVLDCTLRDGGYYNDWDFSSKTVARYLEALSKSGVSCLEIGFRFLAGNGFLGPYAFSTDSFLKRLSLPTTVDIAVMVNAKEILKWKGGIQDAMDILFAPSSDSPVTMVRVATHMADVDGCEPILRHLKDLGYKTALNLMQAGAVGRDRYTDAAETVSRWGTVDILYFADSLGNMDENDITTVVDGLRRGWSGPIGFHAHDNMGRALSNTLKAVDDLGVDWVDATVYGMGRGAGNTRMEFLLSELSKTHRDRFHPDAVFQLVLEDFEDLHQQYQWGTNLLYYLSGAYNIHPTYVQELAKISPEGGSSALDALERLRQDQAASYSTERLQNAITPSSVTFAGTWDCSNRLADRNVLILGAGQWVRENASAVVSFIEDHAPYVISLNTGPAIPDDYIDAYAACHDLRLVLDVNQYLEIGKPLIAPRQAFPEQIRAESDHVNVLDYGMSVETDRFDFSATGCRIPHRLVAAYVFAMANAAGASRLFLVGFDGYEPGNILQRKMSDVFDCYHRNPNTVPIVSVAPTAYPVACSSLYAPLV